MKQLPQNPPLIVEYGGPVDDLTVRLAVAQRAAKHLIVQYTIDGAVVNDCIIGYSSIRGWTMEACVVERTCAGFRCLRCREPARFHP